MTIYSVTNPNGRALAVEHRFTNVSGFQYIYWSQIPANSTETYHVANMPQIPSPFSGTVTFYADAPFTAQVVGYDPPKSGKYYVWIPYIASGR